MNVQTGQNVILARKFGDRGNAAAGLIELAEETPPYVSMPGELGTVPGRGVVLKVL